MRFKKPNSKAITILFFGILSLVMWYMLNAEDAPNTWQTVLQKIGLLVVGGLLTILGANLTWISMKDSSATDSDKKNSK